jgi:adenosylhomocysteine nucleosidase
MNKICVILAMNDEVQDFLDQHQTKIVVLEEKPFKIMQFEQHLIALSGIGLINAAGCLTYVAQKYAPTSFLNVGLAGAVKQNVKILDLLVVEKVYHAGVDATVFGYAFGQTPKEATNFVSDSTLITKLAQIGPFQKATLASSDSFIAKMDQYETQIAPLAAEIQLMDMEAFGYFQTAAKLDIPIVAIKVVSDILTKSEDNNMQFLEILARGSQMITEVMVKYLK